MFKCPCCTEKNEQLPEILHHIEDEHSDVIPKDQTAAQYFYMMKTGKTHGTCIMCKQDTGWNEITSKYHRFCKNPKCKEEYREVFVKRMIDKRGVATMLNDPDHQRKMLANRSISGKYTWSDGKEFTYTGSYEKDFLRFLDVFMNFDSSDIMTPSPHTYYYMFEGKKKFYIPDLFIPSLNLEIEIKDGGDNPNNHHKIQAVDKVKEALKDEVMSGQKTFSYIKVVNKEYDNFVDTLLQMKKDVSETGKMRRIIDLRDNKGIQVKDVVKEGYTTYTDYEGDAFRSMLQAVDSPDVVDKIMEASLLSPELEEQASIYRSFLSKDRGIMLADIEDFDSSEYGNRNYHNCDAKLSNLIDLSSHQRPGFSTAQSDNTFVEILECMTSHDFNEENLVRLCDTFAEKLSEEADPRYIERYKRDGAAFSYYFNLLASKMDKQRLFIASIDKYLTEAVTEAGYKILDEELYPVYVLLTHTGTVLSNVIRAVTKEPYSHASISFDTSLTEMYSFGRKYKNNPLIGTFVREDIHAGLYRDVSESGSYALYVSFVTASEIEGMKRRLAHFKEDGKQYKYSFQGLINYKLGRESDSVDAFFCSQFVDHILISGRQYFDTHSSKIQPMDFTRHRSFVLVDEGRLEDYNSKVCDEKVKSISKRYVPDDTGKFSVAYIPITNDEAKSRSINSDRDVVLFNSVSQMVSKIDRDIFKKYTVVPVSEFRNEGVAKNKENDIVLFGLKKYKITNVNDI